MSQLIAAIDWGIQHRRDNGLNIGVLNLPLGTDSTQPCTLDPLLSAAEVAWRRGITVVVAAGNQGTTRGRLDPRRRPVPAGRWGLRHPQDPRPQRRPGRRVLQPRQHPPNPDLVAPGRSLASLRAPAATTTPPTRPRSWLAGSSGAAAAPRPRPWSPGGGRAVVAAAPHLTPTSARPCRPPAASRWPGSPPPPRAGSLDLARADKTATPTGSQRCTPAAGTGSLELARGPATWPTAPSSSAASRTSSGSLRQPRLGRHEPGRDQLDRGSFNRSGWTGTSWSGATWPGPIWSGRLWSGRMWSADIWSGRIWSGRMWSTGLDT